METPTLNAYDRMGMGKNSAHKVREMGQVPAIIYDIALNKMIAIEKKDLDAILIHYGENAIVNLQLGEESIKSIIKEVQYHPVTNQVIHVDLKPIQQDTRIRTHVPVHLVGNEYIDRSGGVLQKQRQEIEVECMADRIPKFINADISGLSVGQSFKVLDLEVAEELSILTKPNEVIVTLTAANNFGQTEENEAESVE
ncbi:MAG: 50S ribosomal protein L25 [Clostridia bacterium]